MKACKVLLFLLMPFCNMAQSGTVSDPYTALGQAWNVPASGTYYVSIGATTFSTDVESGNGWILVASGSGATDESAYPVTTTLSLQSDRILPAARCPPTQIIRHGQAPEQHSYPGTAVLSLAPLAAAFIMPVEILVVFIG